MRSRSSACRCSDGLPSPRSARVVLAAPILYPQVAATGTRGGGSPIALQTYEVLGEFFAPALRQFLDMPAFWVILLVIELPAIYLTGVYAMLRLTPTLDPDRKRVATILIHLAGASLAVSWLMVSTIGGNNDLGWRAVLPACIVLTVFAVAGLAQWIRTRIRLAIAGFVMIALGLPSGIDIVRYYAFGTPDPAGAAFAATPEMWAAVRRHAGPADRVGNNPMFLESMTPWPVNISWALLSNRRSCYAGYDLALPFIPLPRAAAAGDRCPVPAGVLRRRLARRSARPRHQVPLQGRGGHRPRWRLDPGSVRDQRALAAGRDRARRAGASTSPARSRRRHADANGNRRVPAEALPRALPGLPKKLASRKIGPLGGCK